MCKLLVLIVLCAMCISVFADDYCIFDFEDFDPDKNTADTIIDFSGLEFKSLRIADVNIRFNYLAGDIKLKEKLDSSITVHYNIRNVKKGRIAAGDANACDFIADIYQTYLFPIFGDRVDVPGNNICDWEPADFQVRKPKNVGDLIFESKLKEEASYAYEITFMKGETEVGGMVGAFRLISI